MFRIIKLKLLYGRKLFETAMQFKEVNQIIMDYGFEEFLKFNADQNASRNIEALGKSKYFRLPSTSKSFQFNENPITGRGEKNYNLRSLIEEVLI